MMVVYFDKIEHFSVAIVALIIRLFHSKQMELPCLAGKRLLTAFNDGDHRRESQTCPVVSFIASLNIRTYLMVLLLFCSAWRMKSLSSVCVCVHVCA